MGLDVHMRSIAVARTGRIEPRINEPGVSNPGCATTTASDLTQPSTGFRLKAESGGPSDERAWTRQLALIRHWIQGKAV
jgi:hypothetical protein